MAVVMITGCSSGFGQQAAIALVVGGHKVAATVRHIDDGEPLKAAATNADGTMKVVLLDVTDADACAQAVQKTIETFGRIDALVNNAGMGMFGALEATDDALLRKVFETNFFGPVTLMRLVMPFMRAQGGGRIVNVTSGAAHGVAGFVGPYGAAKHALDAMTAAVDLEAAPFGIRAVTVVPGTFPTTGVATKMVMAPIVEPYADGHIRLMEKLNEAFGDRNDLSVVIDAMVSAVTDSEPAFIALAGPELAGRTGPIVDAKIAFHRMLGGQG